MNELYHHGIKGQKHGIRLYQNKDGSLTPLGRIRYRKMRSERSGDQPATNAAGKKAASSAPAKPREHITDRRNLRRLDLTRMDDTSLQKLKTRLSLEKDVEGMIQSLSPAKERRIRKAIKEAAYRSFENAVNQSATYMVAKVVNALIGEDVVQWKKKN